MQPSSGQPLVDQIRDLSSPVGSFVRERCEVGPGFEIPRKELFCAWTSWCFERNHKTSSDAMFGRDLRAAVPAIDDKRPRDAYGVQQRCYAGIRLKLAPSP